MLSYSILRTKQALRPFYFILRKWVRRELSLSEMAYCRSLYFGQFGEDVFLAGKFYDRPTGFYVDVGAFHPFNGSNTYYFYRRGWRGINIEPNPYSFKAFRKHRSRDINLNVAVSTKEGVAGFVCAEEKSGIDDQTYLFAHRPMRQTKTLVSALPLATLLQKHLPQGTNIDFMSFDCEGHEVEALRSNDWIRFRPSVVLVEEHAKREGDAGKALEEWGYYQTRRLGLTKVFIEGQGAAA